MELIFIGKKDLCIEADNKKYKTELGIALEEAIGKYINKSFKELTDDFYVDNIEDISNNNLKFSCRLGPIQTEIPPDTDVSADEFLEKYDKIKDNALKNLNSKNEACAYISGYLEAVTKNKYTLSNINFNFRPRIRVYVDSNCYKDRKLWGCFNCEILINVQLKIGLMTKSTANTYNERVNEYVRNNDICVSLPGIVVPCSICGKYGIVLYFAKNSSNKLICSYCK